MRSPNQFRSPEFLKEILGSGGTRKAILEKGGTGDNLTLDYPLLIYTKPNLNFKQ
jgi:hypothetical protein